MADGGDPQPAQPASVQRDVGAGGQLQAGVTTGVLDGIVGDTVDSGADGEAQAGVAVGVVRGQRRSASGRGVGSGCR